jgi:DoxX-like family
MNLRLKKLAVSGLQWAVGLVVLLQSAHFALLPVAAHQSAEIGLPPWVRVVLGGSEVIAALLFLTPAAMFIGGYLLLLIFLFAAAIHLLHGNFDVGSLIVYGAAIMVCMAYQSKSQDGGTA